MNEICIGCFGAANNDCETCTRVKGEMMNPTKNSEGYADPTAYHGLKNIIQEEDEVQKQVSQLVYLLKGVADMAGFEVVGRITLKHKQTRKVFR